MPISRLVPPDLPDGQSVQRRCHLVVVARNPATMHFVMRQDLPIRERLVDDIIRFSEAFHGAQINFAPVRPDDGQAYVGFLAELRRRLPDEKMLTVDLPMRVERDVAYDYEAVADITDRVLVII